MTKAARDGPALALIVVVGFLVGELAILRRPDLVRTAGFLFGDEAYSLFVASQLLDGARLYRDVAFPYGWIPAVLYGAVAAAAGNTPLVYLHFLLAVSVAGLVLAYRLIRRLLSRGTALFVTLAGLLPVFVVPGSLLGGYISSFYLPVERLLLLAFALVWQPPRSRTHVTAAGLGGIIVALQMTKFGTGLALLGVLLGLDLLILFTDRQRRFDQWVRSMVTTVAAVAVGLVLHAGVAFAMLPAPVDAWRFVLLPALFAAGAFTFFRTDHHFRQFMWTFAIGSTLALSRYRWTGIVAIAGWTPVAAVVALSLVRPADATRTEILTPNGWLLSVTQSEKARIAGIHGALVALAAREGSGPVLFDSNGVGFHVAYDIPHISRQTWFYPAAVRPYELDTLARQYRRLTALVVCRHHGTNPAADRGTLNQSFPAPLRGELDTRVAETLWSDGTCRVLRLRAASER